MVNHRLSRLFQPKVNIPLGKVRGGDITSNSQKLLFDLGLIRSEDHGTNVLLPVALRALKKLKTIIRKELNASGAQEILLPSLTPLKLLEKTKRDEMSELFKLKDRHSKKYILGPTHEEVITQLISSIKPSYRHLPLSLYQMSNKFRDEMKPRFGLMRSREFLMKDMYCFNTTAESSIKVYEEVNESYHRIFKKIGVPYCCVNGCTGDIGGSLSHEFHIISEVGEDKVIVCNSCGQGNNTTDINIDNLDKCSQCGSTDVKSVRGIEVGHSFLLGTKYSDPLQAHYTTSDNTSKLLEMSCHGIGITRLLAASVEALSTSERIRWPSCIAPFTICIIPPKHGSKEESTTFQENVNNELLEKFSDEVVMDDRTDMTIGKRILEAKRMGYPFLVVIGKLAASDGKVEVINTNDDKTEHLPLKDLSQFIECVI